MEKRCIFCGNKLGESKNLEHIIPVWLIKYTGSLKRQGYFGVDLKKAITEMQQEGTIKKIKDVLRFYSFNSFCFPSCKECNNTFSKLEAKVKISLIKLVEKNQLSSNDFNIILDWFDKIRVGLWLGFRQLNTDIFGITPRFYIRDRIGRDDRLILIYKIEGISKGINFLGADLPAFQAHPSFVGIRINQFFFINISDSFLISESLGLPYFKTRDMIFLPETKEFGAPLFKINLGKEFVKYPLIKSKYNKLCSEIYQPIVPPRLLQSMDSNIKNIYSSEYVKNLLNIESANKGKILISSKNEIIEYPNNPSKIWIPKETSKGPKSIFKLFKEALPIYNDILRESLKISFPNDEIKKVFETQVKLYLKIQKSIQEMLS